MTEKEQISITIPVETMPEQESIVQEILKRVIYDLQAHKLLFEDALGRGEYSDDYSQGSLNGFESAINVVKHNLSYLIQRS